MTTKRIHDIIAIFPTRYEAEAYLMERAGRTAAAIRAAASRVVL